MSYSSFGIESSMKFNQNIKDRAQRKLEIVRKTDWNFKTEGTLNDSKFKRRSNIFLAKLKKKL